MKLKICGLKYKDNIEQVANLQPDYMGFIFYPKSKRFVGDDFVMPEISSEIKKVGVFVNETIEKTVRIAKKHDLNYIQLHGSEDPLTACFLKTQGFKVIKAFSISTTIDYQLLNDFAPFCNYFLFDTKGENPGGNGIKFSWKLLNTYYLPTPFFLSGGIQPGDIDELKKIDHPAFLGVDINSGFETSPGIKNVETVKKFIDEIRIK